MQELKPNDRVHLYVNGVMMAECIVNLMYEGSIVRVICVSSRDTQIRPHELLIVEPQCSFVKITE